MNRMVHSSGADPHDETPTCDRDGCYPIRVTHAHVSSQSRDCDGEYRSGYIAAPTVEEIADDHGDYLFRERMIAGLVSVYAEQGTLEVTPDRVEWHQRTDEGYTSSTLIWCDDTTCDTGQPRWVRDLTAEKAGY